MGKMLPFPMQGARIDCYVFERGGWRGAHLSQVKKDDWFRLIGSDKLYIADSNAYLDGNDEWKVDAHFHVPSKG